MGKNEISEIVSSLKKEKVIAMIAPSFPAEFSYPSLLNRLRVLGFDKSVELTFGAKMINREYHKQLKKSKGLLISSACPGVVSTIVNKYPQYKKNLIKVDSPMVATAKICKKWFPGHKTCFISPCDFKKIEAEKSKYVDYVIDYEQLRVLFKGKKIDKCDDKCLFNRFYNDYTKVYPLSGALAKTAHLNGVIKEDEIFVADGIKKIMKFLDNPDPKIKFMDVLFCVGGCIGGPRTSKKWTIAQKRKKIFKYLERSKDEDIPEDRKGLIKAAKGVGFGGKVWFG